MLIDIFDRLPQCGGIFSKYTHIRNSLRKWASKLSMELLT